MVEVDSGVIVSGYLEVCGFGAIGARPGEERRDEAGRKAAATKRGVGDEVEKANVVVLEDSEAAGDGLAGIVQNCVAGGEG